MPTLDGSAPVSSAAVPLPEGPSRDLAVSVCAGAMRLKKERGLNRVSRNELVATSDRRPSEVEEGITLALQYGWLVRRDDFLALSAAGIWVAKQALNLPR